jgi:hypothetical protein
MKSKIFIASKGRAGNSNIIAELEISNIEYYLFIEPSEVELYTFNYPNAKIINIKKDDNGLPYVRNFMLKYALENNIEIYWNLDDDVKLYKVINGRCIHATVEILFEAEKFFINDNTIAQAGLEYRQFAWSANSDYKINSYCDCVVAIKTNLCKGLTFDEKSLLKLDRDFSIQVIKSGFKTCKINKYAFSSPENGSNKGGLHEIYKSGIEKENVKYMVEKWGDKICLPIVKENGRNDVKIMWNEINSNQISLF